MSPSNFAVDAKISYDQVKKILFCRLNKMNFTNKKFIFLPYFSLVKNVKIAIKSFQQQRSISYGSLLETVIYQSFTTHHNRRNQKSGKIAYVEKYIRSILKYFSKLLINQMFISSSP